MITSHPEPSECQNYDYNSRSMRSTPARSALGEPRESLSGAS